MINSKKKDVVDAAGTAGLTLLFKCEVLCEVSTLMVASEEEQGVGVVDLQSPQVQYTLKGNR